MLEGMRREDEEVEQMLADPAEPTFDNTLVRDHDDHPKDYYNLLGRVSGVFFNLLSAEGNEEMEALAQKMSPLLTKHANDISPFEKAAWQKAIIGQQLPQTCMTTQFSHIMAGGYAAGYYSYKWAEVLETDAFGAFQEHGIFDQATAQRFRDCVLSKGGTEHPMTLYKRFRGHEPTIDAMLRRDGIKKQ